jgi:hypothetical protein
MIKKIIFLAFIFSMIFLQSGCSSKEKDEKINELQNKIILLTNENSTLKVSFAKNSSELEQQQQKVIQLEKEKSFKVQENFTQHNKDILEKEFLKKYGSSVAIIIILLMASLFYSLKKLKEEKLFTKQEIESIIISKQQELEQLKVKITKQEELHSEKNDLIKSLKEKIFILEQKISQGAKNEIVEKINELQQERHKKISMINSL